MSFNWTSQECESQRECEESLLRFEEQWERKFGSPLWEEEGEE